VRKLDPKHLSYLWYALWPTVLLVQFGSKIDFRDFLRADFWLDAGRVLLITLGVIVAIAGVIYAYYRFCRWFDRTIEGQRSRLHERLMLRNGEIAWPASDPLHDPELDG
jgi:hypothetical protein